jgi:hypothetical protein
MLNANAVQLGPAILLNLSRNEQENFGVNPRFDCLKDFLQMPDARRPQSKAESPKE